MKRAEIERIKMRTVFDSRGVETIEVDVFTESGFGRVAAPFGAPGSRGAFEAQAYAPGGVQESIEIIENDFIPSLLGMDAGKTEEIDRIIKEKDGTENFSRIGGNASSSLSLACARAAADTLDIRLVDLLNPHEKHTLPLPIGNIIGGGAHSLGPCPDMQEHLAIPIGAKNIKEAIALNIEVHETVKSILAKKIPGFVGGMDDECAWVGDLTDVEALEVLFEASKAVGKKRGVEIGLGLDVAADRLWDQDKQCYTYFREGVERTTAQQVEYLASLIEPFNLVYIEDGFQSNDYAAFAALKHASGDCLVCADDLTASNEQRLSESIQANSANAIIIKPNQVGTLTGALRTADLAEKNGYKVALSHRSGETVDDTIAHLAVAWEASFIKTGVIGGERLAKLNELIRLDEAFGNKARTTNFNL